MKAHLETESVVLHRAKISGLAEWQKKRNFLVSKAQNILENFHLDELTARELVGFVTYDVVVDHIIKSEIKLLKSRRKSSRRKRSSSRDGHANPSIRTEPQVAEKIPNWGPTRFGAKPISANCPFNDPFLRADFLQVHGEIFGLAKARRRHALVLLVQQGDALTHGRLQPLGYPIIAHRKQEFFWRRSRNRNQRQFTLPGLADPSFVRHLLQIACALAAGITPVQAKRHISREQNNDRSDQPRA